MDALSSLYRSSLGGDGRTLAPAWEMALQAHFGGLQPWREDFVARAQQAQLDGAAGGLALVFDAGNGSLANRMLDPAAGPAGTVPLLALPLAAQPAVEFVDAIAWAGVYERYQAAVHDASEAFGATQDEAAGAARLLDVRRAGAFAAADTMLAGAAWRDPAALARWRDELAPGDDVVLYCVYGHEVCRATALRLRAAGIPARFLRGGIDAWAQAGRPLQPKPR